jgi:N6-L-threonylcarbamoyladenine synthase
MYKSILKPQMNKSSFSQTRQIKVRSVLGIETSCDDTGVAIVNSNGKILSERLITHYDIVKQYGGVFPNEVAPYHQQTIQRLISETIDEASGMNNFNGIDAVAVTCGPGLNPCLKVGVQSAKLLARELQKPIIAVNHLEAHLLISRMFATELGSNIQFPFLTLLVSGGHCLLVHAEKLGTYKILATTTDDSIGEAFDKVARLLNIEYGTNEFKSPGAAMEHHAKLYNDLSLEDKQKYPAQFAVPLRLRRKGDVEFSFSGLKSNVLRYVRLLEKNASPETAVMDMNEFMAKNRNLHGAGANIPHEAKICIIHSFQNIAFTHLLEKTELALQKYDVSNVTDFVVCGGVAANQELRTRLSQMLSTYNMNMRVAPVKYCTDNGVMVAWTGMERYLHSNDLHNESIDDLDLRGRWPLHTLSDTRNFVKEDQDN